MPKLPRRVSGYNLDSLLPENGCDIAQALVGSESTLVVILEATIHLVPNPKARSLVVFGYPDIYSAGDHVMEILPLKPTGLEGIDHLLFEWCKRAGDIAADLKLLPEGKGFLLVEFGGDSKEDSDAQARHCMDVIRKTNDPPTMKLFDDPAEEENVWDSPRERSGCDGLGPRTSRWLAGLGRFGRPAGEGRPVPARSARALQQIRLRAVPLRPPGSGLHPLPRRIRPLYGRGARLIANSWTKRPTWSSRTAVRSRASTETDRPAASCSRECMDRN